MDSEINTEAIIFHMFDNGKECFVPRFQPGTRIMNMLRITSIDDYMEMPVNRWGIRQPPLDDIREDALHVGLDLIIVPGVAFTKDGMRLGHGGGFYDNYFQSIKPMPYKMGICFWEQIVDSIPNEPHDVKVDAVIYATT